MKVFPHQQRVLIESQELNEKIVKLESFLETEMYRDLQREDKVLLLDQLEAMQQYWQILELRIARF